MAGKYQGNYNFQHGVVENWNSAAIGVYYCGYVSSSGSLHPVYIGRAIGEEGIRGRLLDHLREDSWQNATHFGYVVCASPQEAINLEQAEIKRCRPPYNTQGK